MFLYEENILTFQSKEKPSFRMNYLLALPEDRKPDEQLPLVVCLHGAGERGVDTDLLKVHGIPKYLEKGLPIRAAILAPQLFSTDLIWNTVIHELMELIRFVRDGGSIDKNRVYVTGMSMGGYGTWELAMSYTGEFAAIAPICGGGTPWRAWRLASLPIRAYHGDADDTVPLHTTLEMVDSIKAAGGKPECIILHDVGHNSWDWAYEHTDLMQWLVSHTKI